MENIIVTGTAGFFGSKVSQILMKKGRKLPSRNEDIALVNHTSGTNYIL